MNKNRMTEKELDKLLESGFVELECDDKRYNGDYNVIIVLKKINRGGAYIVECKYGGSGLIGMDDLTHYASKVQPKTWYQAVYTTNGFTKVSTYLYTSKEAFDRENTDHYNAVKMIPVYTEGE